MSGLRKGKVSLIFILILVLTLPGLAKGIKITSGLFSSIKARSIGPAVMGGRITAIDAVAKDPRIIYVGTAGGGLWKTTNGGITFKPIFDKYTMSIGTITIDQNNPDTVWVGTGETNVRNSVSVGTGLYKTEDGGKTWKFMGFKNSERIAKVVVHPGDSKIVYVCVMGHLWNDHKERGVYKTEDGGKTWKRLLYVNEKTGCADLVIDPQEPDVLYASMWQFRRLPWFFNSGGPGSGLYRTKDGGKTWKKLTRGLPEGPLGRIALAIAPSRPATLYAKVEAKKGSGLYRSDDMGENWRKMNDTIAVKMRPFYFASLTVDPTDHRRVYVAGLMLAVSRDGGKSFNFLFENMGTHPDLHSIWVNPKDPNNVMVGTDGGVYESTNKGVTFRFLNNLPVSQFYHVWYDMEVPYNVYGGLQDNGAWYGPSNSFTGQGIKNSEWKNVGGGDGFYVFPHPKDPDIVYYSWQEGNLERFNRRTLETKDIKPMPVSKDEPEYRFNWDAAVALSHHDPDTIYIGAQFLFKSTNRGDTWEKISPDLTTNDPAKLQQEKSGGLTPDVTGAENHCTIVTISESPLDKNIIWVGTDDGNLQITRDGGKHWENVVKNVPGIPANTWVSSVEASHFDPAVAYVTFDGHRTGDMKPYVYKTTDYGKTWIPLTTDSIEGYCHVVREDLKNPNLLFLGTEFGLYISVDGGKQWARIKSIPEVAVRDIAIHPREHDLLLATHGRGIMIIDDITALRSLNQEILEAPAAVLPSRPAIMRIPTFLQEFPGDSEFFGENLPEGAFITYYLKKRHIFGDLKLEILDENGKVIKTLPAKKSRGINRIFWDMRLKPPKTGFSPGLGMLISTGPMVKEGTYTVRLVKGKNVYEGKITLLPDPRTKYTKQDREIRHKLVMKLYQMQEDLAYIADSVKSLKDQAESKAARTRSKRLSKKLKAFAKKMDEFHGTIVRKGGLMTRGKLREKVMELYSSVISYGGRPTDSQIYYAKVLEEKIKDVRSRFEHIIQKDVAKLNKLLAKAKIEPLHVMTQEEYSKKQ